MIPSDVQPSDLFQDSDGVVYRVVSVCHEPTVTMQRIVDSIGVDQSGRHMTGTFGCLNFSAFRRLRPEA